MNSLLIWLIVFFWCSLLSSTSVVGWSESFHFPFFVLRCCTFFYHSHSVLSLVKLDLDATYISHLSVLPYIERWCASVFFSTLSTSSILTKHVLLLLDAGSMSAFKWDFFFFSHFIFQIFHKHKIQNSCIQTFYV